jgi:FkbM family methyltransferase
MVINEGIDNNNDNIYNVNNNKYYIHNQNDIIEKTLMSGKQWNNDMIIVIKDLVKKYKLKHFVNIGAHIGSVCIPISRNIQQATAIEAYPKTFTKLNNNIKLNNIKNINTINCAIGNKNEDVYFLDDTHDRLINNSGGMHVITNDNIKNNERSANIVNKSINVEMIQFDDLNLDPDIILLDIEGMEYEFLLGSSNTIKKYKPIIIMEIWDNNKRKSENMSTTKQDILSHMDNMGYKIYIDMREDIIFISKNHNTYNSYT